MWVPVLVILMYIDHPVLTTVLFIAGEPKMNGPWSHREWSRRAEKSSHLFPLGDRPSPVSLFTFMNSSSSSGFLVPPHASGSLHFAPWLLNPCLAQSSRHHLLPCIWVPGTRTSETDNFRRDRWVNEWVVFVLQNCQGQPLFQYLTNYKAN